MGDEDEGSCSQEQVNRETGKIEGSADALRVNHHPIPFPPIENYPINTARATEQPNADRVATMVISE